MATQDFFFYRRDFCPEIQKFEPDFLLDSLEDNIRANRNVTDEEYDQFYFQIAYLAM